MRDTPHQNKRASGDEQSAPPLGEGTLVVVYYCSSRKSGKITLHTLKAPRPMAYPNHLIILRELLVRRGWIRANSAGKRRQAQSPRVHPVHAITESKYQ